jgi:hypothetical protein
VGSSRNKTLGKWTNPRAISARRFSPPDKALTGAFRHSSMSTSPRTNWILSLISDLGTA